MKDNQFTTLDLIEALQECERRIPSGQLVRSREGTGNLCIYDGADSYVGIIDLHGPPRIELFHDYETADES